MTKGAKTLLSRFRRCPRGATAVEFGLIALPFFAVIGAIFEIAYVDFESELLQASLTNATRQMMIGAVQSGGAVTDAQSFVNTYLCQSSGRRTLPGNFDCSKLVVDVRPAASFSDANMSKSFYRNSDNKFCPGAPGDVVVMRVDYPMKAIFPLNMFNRYVGLVNDVPNQGGWYHMLMSSALYQNENYAGSYTKPATC